MPNPTDRTLVAKHLAAKWPNAAREYVSCRQDHIVLECMECGTLMLGVKTCHLRICPECMNARSIRFRQEMRERLHDLGPLRFITLTLPSHLALTNESIRHLRHCFNALKKIPYIKDRLGPHAYHIEATPKDGLWHIHIHILTAGEFIPQRVLSRLWREVSGAPIVDIRKVKDNDRAVNELCKYLGKPAGFDDPKLKAEYALALKGIHLFQCCAGLKPAKQPQASLPCPICGKTCWLPTPWMDFEDYSGRDGHLRFKHPLVPAIECATGADASSYTPPNPI